MPITSKKGVNLLNYGLSALLGVVQGVAEFLPISSSGHLTLLQYYFGMEEADTLFNILLHFATLLAVCLAYRQDIMEMIAEFISMVLSCFQKDKKKGARESEELSHPRKLVLFIILGTLPLFAVLPIDDKVEAFGNNPYFVSCALLVTGTLLFTADRSAKANRSIEDMTWKDALIIGVAQGFATIPGLSRSGCTISAALTLGIQRSFAVRYSFLLSLPAVAGATLLKVFDMMQEGIDNALLPMYGLGMVIAFVVGFFSIQLVKILADKGKFGAFAYYCWAAGSLSLVALFMGY